MKAETNYCLPNLPTPFLKGIKQTLCPCSQQCGIVLESTCLAFFTLRIFPLVYHCLCTLNLSDPDTGRPSRSHEETSWIYCPLWLLSIITSFGCTTAVLVYASLWFVPLRKATRWSEKELLQIKVNFQEASWQKASAHSITIQSSTLRHRCASRVPRTMSLTTLEAFSSFHYTGANRRNQRVKAASCQERCHANLAHVKAWSDTTRNC